MKQTNNAIKFLMAQYRAIYKHAYLKGILTASVLTLGLATGAANAGSVSSISAEDTNVTEDSTLTVQVTDSANKESSGSLIITSSAVSHSLKSNIDTAGATLNLSGNLTFNPTGSEKSVLTIGSEDSKAGLAVTFSGTGSIIGSNAAIVVEAGKSGAAFDEKNNSSLTFSNDVTFSGSTLTLTNSKLGQVSFSAKNLKATNTEFLIGSKAEGVDQEAKFTATTATLDNSTLKLISATADKSIVSGDSFSLSNNSKIETDGLGGKLETKSLSLTSSAINIAKDSTLDISIKNQETTKGIFKADNASLTLDGVLKLTSDTSGASYDLTSSTIKLTEGVVAGQNAGLINAVSKSDIVLKQDQVALVGVKLTDADSSLTIKDQSENATAFDLSNAVVATDTSLGAGKIVLGAAGIKIKTTGDMSVSSALKGSHKANLEVQNLSLGSSSYDNSGLNFSGATIYSDLTVNSAQDVFKLKEQITFDRAQEDLSSTSAEIHGKFIEIQSGSKGITVNNKDVIAKQGLGFAKDTSSTDVIIVSGTTSNASLTINNKFVLGGSGAITVKADAGNSAVLDISNADLSFASTTNTENGNTITIDANGELKIKSADLVKLVNSGTNNTKTVINTGKLTAVGDLKFDASKFVEYSDSITANEITFGTSEASTGDVFVDGVFTLEKNFQAFTKAHTFTAKSFVLEPGEENSAFTVGANTTLVSLGDISTNNTTNSLQVSGGTLQLGQSEKVVTDAVTYYKPLSTGGNISMNLDIDSGKVQVDAGAWTASVVDVGGGTLDIGNSEARKDQLGNQINASFDVSNLLVTGGTVTVNDGGSSSVNTIDLSSGGRINLSGIMNISGKYTAAVDGEEPKPASYGVSIAKDTINVQNNGVLNIGKDASKAITIDAEKNVIKLAEGTFASGALNLSAGGLVSFAFDSSMSFDAKTLASLRKEIFDSEQILEGRINIGDAKITGITVGEDNKISWDSLEPYSEFLVDIEQDSLLKAVVTDVKNSSKVKGNYGALQSTEITKNGYVNIADNISLQNATGNNGLFASNGSDSIGLSVAQGKSLDLINDGKAGNIKLAQDANVKFAQGNISVDTILGVAGSKVELFNSNTSIAQNAEAGYFVTNKESALSVGNISAISTDKASVFEGKLVAKDASFASYVSFAGETALSSLTAQQDVEFSGQTTISKDLSVAGFAGIYANTKVDGLTTLSGNAEIGDNATLFAKQVTMTAHSAGGAPTVLSVGEDKYIDADGKEQLGSTGYLQADSVVLNGNMLLVDPDYSKATSIAAIKSLSGLKTDLDKANAGILDGTLILAQNSAVMLGKDASVEGMQAILEQNDYLDGASLVKQDVGAVLALNSQLQVAADKQIILDPHRSKQDILGTEKESGSLAKKEYAEAFYALNKDGTQDVVANSPKFDADLYLSNNSVLFITDNVLKEQESSVNKIAGAVHFQKEEAAIMGEKDAKIVLGDAYLDTDNIILFTDADTSGKSTGVKVLGTENIRVESLNGLMSFELLAGDDNAMGGTLTLDHAKVDKAYLEASEPVRNTLLQVASKTVNFDEFYNQTPEQKATNPVERIYVADGLVNNKNIAYYDATNKQLVVVDTKNHTESDFVVNEGKVYYKGQNAFLAKVTQQGSGVETDQVARMPAFAGAVEAALVANASTYETVTARMGMGAQQGSLSFADNSQGAGLFGAPLYKNYESDGFGAQGIKYGSDLDMYGIALGGDITLANGLRLGVLANVGSGDADGTGAAKGVSNDFDYYGFAAYAGYSMGKFSVVGDLGYTVVDNDVVANTFVEKTAGKMDSKAITIGVTGQYALALGGMDITPHAGLRFTRLDINDFTVEGAQSGQIGHVDSADLNIFSIPVGVSVSKDIVAGTWTVKPSFDFTVTGNFGDDTLDSSTKWNGISNIKTDISSEVIDSFTYGIGAGVAAKSGNFSLGLGVNYTGSSNTDSYGVNANARFVF